MKISYKGKKIMAAAALISVCIVSVVVSAEDSDSFKTGYCAQCHSGENRLSPEDFSKWEKRTGDIPPGWLEDSLNRISNIEDTVAQLKLILTDTTEQEAVLVRTKQHLRRLVHSEPAEDMKNVSRIIELELNSLEAKTSAQLAHAERLDILYILMLVVTMSLVFGISVYVLYMYMKRKK